MEMSAVASSNWSKRGRDLEERVIMVSGEKAVRRYKGGEWMRRGEGELGGERKGGGKVRKGGAFIGGVGGGQEGG